MPTKITLEITLSDDEIRELGTKYGYAEPFIMNTPMPQLREMVIAEMKRRIQEFASRYCLESSSAD
jgi:hypothetical protein